MKYACKAEVTIPVNANSIEEAETEAVNVKSRLESTVKNASSVELSYNCVIVTDDAGNKLPTYHDYETGRDKAYIPMCPYCNNDCILDRNYNNRCNFSGIAYTGKACKGCIDGSRYDDEDK